MPDIDIKRKHNLSKREAKTKIEKLVKRLKKNLPGWECEWIEEHILEGVATGLKMGRITIKDTIVHIEIDLGWLVPAALAKKKVLESLDDYFAGLD